MSDDDDDDDEVHAKTLFTAMSEMLDVLQVVAAKHNVCRVCLALSLAESLDEALKAGVIQHDGPEGFQGHVH